MKIAQTMALAAVLVALVVCGGASSSHDLAIAQNVPPQGDHTFRITHIKFDHTGPDANTSAEPTDGLRIRRDGRAKLKHEGNGAGAGEWVRGSNNEEALYVAGKRVTIKVRIECDDPVRTAVFSAIQKGVDPTLPPSLKPWTDVAEKQVEFQERPVGSGL